MKITTKFAFTGLIFSVLCVQSALANANAKSVIDVASLKSCEFQDNESESPCKEEELATKYGSLFLVKNVPDYDDLKLFFKGNEISDAALGYRNSFEKIFHFKNSEVVLLHTTDGNAPDDYLFLRIMVDGTTKFSNSIRDAISTSTEDLTFLHKDGYQDSISENYGELKTIQSDDKIIINLANNFEGTRRITTYENDHILIKRIENKNAMQIAKENNCKDTYVNYKSYINPTGGTGFSCGDQSVNYSNAENRSHMFLGANFGNAIRYTCKTRKLIDFSTFKKIVCIYKKQ